jgi:hypothetical protein
MARQIDKLSALGAAKLTKPGYHGDGGGLWLQISKANGGKNWVFRFTSPVTGKAREMGLGAFHTISLLEARAKAKECRQMVAEGRDPIEERLAIKCSVRQEAAKLMTFDQCAAAYIEAQRNGWKNPKHALQWESTLATYASPVFGALSAASVDLPLVL